MCSQPRGVRVVSTRIAYENPWMRVREDEFVAPDGLAVTYGVVDKPDFALVIAEQDGVFHLVEQFRYPIGRTSLEFPMGTWSAGRTGTALDLARAELAEETGLTARCWRHLGRRQLAGGFCSQGFDVFHAAGLAAGTPRREDTEADMVHLRLTEVELRRALRDGTITDAATLAGYALYELDRRGVDLQ